MMFGDKNCDLDPDVELMYVVPDRPISRQHLCVDVSEKFNRQPLPPDAEKQIDCVWQLKVSQNPSIYNGTKFRIHAAVNYGQGVVFHLGVTDYKDFIGTNWSPHAHDYLQLGLAQRQNSHAYMSDALGVGSIVITADNQVLLLRRSAMCAEAAGLLDIPGGHPEPQELVGKIPASEIDVDKLDPDAVVAEIFGSTIREICDEVNIPSACVTDPELMGIARNTTSAGRPSSEYIVRCSLTSVEVQSRYAQGDHAEAEESTGLVIIPLQAVATLQTDNPQLWNQLAPSAKGCFTLYRMLFHTSNGGQSIPAAIP